jgi:hypothetical protein
VRRRLRAYLGIIVRAAAVGDVADGAALVDVLLLLRVLVVLLDYAARCNVECAGALDAALGPDGFSLLAVGGFSFFEDAD